MDLCLNRRIKIRLSNYGKRYSSGEVQDRRLRGARAGSKFPSGPMSLLQENQQKRTHHEAVVGKVNQIALSHNADEPAHGEVRGDEGGEEGDQIGHGQRRAVRIMGDIGCSQDQTADTDGNVQHEGELQGGLLLHAYRNRGNDR